MLAQRESANVDDRRDFGKAPPDSAGFHKSLIFKQKDPDLDQPVHQGINQWNSKRRADDITAGMHAMRPRDFVSMEDEATAYHKERKFKKHKKAVKYPTPR